MKVPCGNIFNYKMTEKCAKKAYKRAYIQLNHLDYILEDIIPVTGVYNVCA